MITRPALRYHGGKFRLAPWALMHMPDHRKYVEPFGGAAGVLLRKPRAYAEVYNDLDDDIVNFFNVISEPATKQELIRRLRRTPYARTIWRAAFAHTTDPVQRALNTAVRAQMGFGSAGATKGTGGFRIDTDREGGTAMDNWVSYPQAVEEAGERFMGVLIENRPAIDVIKQHDATDALFYVDPPYVPSTRQIHSSSRYYRHEMTVDQHIELLRVLRQTLGMVMLCGYDNDEYNAQLKDWKKVSTTARIAANRGTGIRTECMWLNPACVQAMRSYTCAQIELLEAA